MGYKIKMKTVSSGNLQTGVFSTAMLNALPKDGFPLTTETSYSIWNSWMGFTDMANKL